MSDVARIENRLADLPFVDLARLGLAMSGLRVRAAARALGCSPSQMSNVLAGRRHLEPSSQSALLELVGLQPLLVARRHPALGRGGRLSCDALTLHGESLDLTLERAAESLCGSQGWRPGRRPDRGVHARIRVRDGLRVEWHREDVRAAEVRIELKPIRLGDQGVSDARHLLSTKGSSWRVARVDVAADYPVPRHGVELIGVATRSGMVVHERAQGEWVVPFAERPARIGDGFKSSRVGSPRSETHVRCYAHPAFPSAGGGAPSTRIEAQVKPPRGRRRNLRALPHMVDPFAAVVVVVLDPEGLEYPWTCVLRDLGLFGSAYMRARLSPTEWRDLIARLRAAGRPTLHPTPSELFMAQWKAVATEFLARLGVSAQDEKRT